MLPDCRLRFDPGRAMCQARVQKPLFHGTVHSNELEHFPRGFLKELSGFNCFHFAE